MSDKPSINEKNVTINDIAKRAKVSKSTVSRVINDTTPVNATKRKAVLDAMKKMKFEPNIFAQGLAGGQSKTIGVLTQNIGSPFYDSISQGILSKMAGSGYSPIFADGQSQPEIGQVAVDALLGRRVDGLILIGGRLASEKYDQLKSQVPTIAVGHEVEGWTDQCIFIDNELAAFEATQHLIGLGHRKIAHITGIKNHPDAIQRQSGYCRALTESGFEVDQDLICEGCFDGNSGVMAIETLLLRGKHFSAIFAANDMTAFGARLALYRKGIRVPEDISIIGFDDQAESAYMTPPLTTVRQPANEMGVAAADAIIKLINRQPYELTPNATEIVIRQSTRART